MKQAVLELRASLFEWAYAPFPPYSCLSRENQQLQAEFGRHDRQLFTEKTGLGDKEPGINQPASQLQEGHPEYLQLNMTDNESTHF